MKNTETPPLTQRPILGVDATPDEQYPIRILEAYLYNARTNWEVSGLNEGATKVYEEMNRHQAERVLILERAIAALNQANAGHYDNWR